MANNNNFDVPSMSVDNRTAWGDLTDQGEQVRVKTEMPDELIIPPSPTMHRLATNNRQSAGISKKKAAGKGKASKAIQTEEIPDGPSAGSSSGPGTALYGWATQASSSSSGSGEFFIFE
jgi:hypothetical protein